MMNKELDGMEVIELTDEESAEVVGGKNSGFIKANEANKGGELICPGVKKKDKRSKTCLRDENLSSAG